MGDIGEAFKAFREMKAEQRSLEEPKRVKYALEQLAGISAEIEDTGDMLLIHTNKGDIQFWPFTGWFCGEHPLEHLKGRGIKTLKEQLLRSSQ